jgi:cbb3-type cytochrome oxidase cytochrome c subunit
MVAIVISFAGIIEIVPLMSQAMVEPVPGLEPRNPLNWPVKTYMY